MDDVTVNIRADNLDLLVERFEGKIGQFAKAAGISASHASQALARTPEGEPKFPVGERLARKIEANLKLPRTWLDQPQGTIPEISEAPHLADASAAGRTLSLEGLSDVQVALCSVVAKLARSGKLPDHECIGLLAQWQNRLTESGS
jgi:hypothetical protein